MSEKRTLADIAACSAVGTSILANAINLTITFYNLKEKMSPELQEYIGTWGTTLLGYGGPTIILGSNVIVGGIAVVATDAYMRSGHIKT